MADLAHFDPNGISNPKNNLFGLPTSEEESRLVILPVPWEVTVSYGAGTSRAPAQVFAASMQVDLLDQDSQDAWRQGIYMRPIDRKILMKSDYLRKEAELYIDYIAKGGNLANNAFMDKSLQEINEGSTLLNTWVYEQTRDLLLKGKLVGLLGGDHSVSLGYLQAIAEKYGSFAVLQIDAHCDLRQAYEGFVFSHGSIMFNALEQIPQIQPLLQVGVRDYCNAEWQYFCQQPSRIRTFFDQDIRERQFEGQTWKQICADILQSLPQLVYVSVDIDGLDPKLARHTGTPVPGGLDTAQLFYLIKTLLQSGRRLIGFDLVEIGTGETGWDANVGARILWKLCNFLISSNR